MITSIEVDQKLKEVENNRKIIESHLRKLGLDHHWFFIDGKDFDTALKVNDIQVITSNEEGILVTDINGKTYQTKATMTLFQAEKDLLLFSQFIRSHERFLVNLNHLDYFSPSISEPQGKNLTFRNNFRALLSASNADKIKRYFNIKSLEHVEPWNEKYQSIIDENLRSFEKEIRFMSADELKDNFKYQSTNQFNIREFGVRQRFL